MKKILISLVLLIAVKSYSQDSTIVTNLQLKVLTVKKLGVAASSFKSEPELKAFVKWYSYIKLNGPSDNANITIDTIPVTMILSLYSLAINDVVYDDITSDLSTALQSKRNTNNYLDSLLTSEEAILASKKQKPLQDGNLLFTGN